MRNISHGLRDLHLGVVLPWYRDYESLTLNVPATFRPPPFSFKWAIAAKLRGGLLARSGIAHQWLRPREEPGVDERRRGRLQVALEHRKMRFDRSSAAGDHFIGAVKIENADIG